jgi:hypothetical protein
LPTSVACCRRPSRTEREITSVCADFLVVGAVLGNQSPESKFPAIREKNREITKNACFEPNYRVK